MSNSQDDDEVHKDLTRLEDLSEFLHEEDPDLETKFDDFNDNSKKSPPKKEEIIEESVGTEEEFPPIDLPIENDEFSPSYESEIMQEISSEIEDSESSSDFLSEEATFDLNSSELNNEDVSNLESKDFNLDVLEEAETSNPQNELLEDDSFFSGDEIVNAEEKYAPTPIEISPHEKFEDVKNFAQNFSYGTIEGAGNPPFSVIIRNIKFNEDADDILSLLKELAVLTDSNLKDYEKAIQLGSIIIPQISEFTAIIIAHKLRRFDLDIEVGLADEIHPSKSGDNNPRGLTQKGQLKQNREEQFKPSNKSFSINDILMTTNNTIEGYQIKKYMGIDHAHTFIDDEELERLHFINKSLREKNANADDIEHYKNYKDSFNKLHDELLNEIKTRAYKNGSNALIGVQFSMNQMADHKKSQYQLSCSATFALVEKI